MAPEVILAGDPDVIMEYDGRDGRIFYIFLEFGQIIDIEVLNYNLKFLIFVVFFIS